MEKQSFLNIRCSEVLPTDGNGSRLLRSGLLSDYVYQQTDLDLDWVISSFDHYHKYNRLNKDVEPKGNLEVYSRITMLRSTGYSSNLSPMRFIDHLIYSIRLMLYLFKYRKNKSILFCSYPTVDSSVVVVLMAKLFGHLSVIDIRDKWPDVFFDKKDNFIFKLIFLPYTIMRNYVFKNADVVIATNHEFLNWSKKIGYRTSANDRVFPIGYKLLGDPSESFYENIIDKYPKSDGDLVISYGGTIGRMFDFDTLHEAFEILNEMGVNYKFYAFGDGDAIGHFREKFASNKNVYFPGRVDSKDLFSFFLKSDILVANYIQSSNFKEHIPNKISEYLAAGKMVLTSLEGAAGKLIESNDAGFIYRGAEDFANKVGAIFTEDVDRAGKNAKELFENNFHIDSINKKIVDHCLDVFNKK